jgi:carboxyl-terminal processing protease
VLSPIEGGPAARAGIISGDELVQIDDQALVGMNNEEVATRLRGRAGTSVTLKLRRPVCYIQVYLYIDEDDTFRFQ